MYLLNTVIYGVCAVLWFINGARDGDVLDYVIAAIWLAGCILNFARYLKEKKPKED